MDKKQRYKLYKHSVGPGWWHILDKYVPKILEADPECSLYIKEKYGFLRIEMTSQKINLRQRINWENAAELESSTVCEDCGRPGRHRTDRAWYRTLCDRCAAVENDLQMYRSIEEAAERLWWEEATE